MMLKNQNQPQREMRLATFFYLRKERSMTIKEASTAVLIEV